MSWNKNYISGKLMCFVFSQNIWKNCDDIEPVRACPNSILSSKGAMGL